MEQYEKPSGPGAGEYDEKRSRFLGEVWPVSDEAEARGYVDAARKKHPAARHHCWAWVLPDGTARWSDDGEPGGTAGAPMLSVLQGARVRGAVCIVTRYFGGTLLGSGGLVRAYSKAAALALADAGTEPDPDRAELTLACPWDSLDRVHRLVRELGGAVTETDYESDPARATLRAALPADAAEHLAARLVELTAGRGEVVGSE